MWNYRVMKTQRSRDWPEAEYVIAEVYYDDEEEESDRSLSWAIGGYCDCENQVPGMRPWGGDPEELHAVLEMMLTAFDRPILDESVLLEDEEGVGC